jgi:hypothetical protein
MDRSLFSAYLRNTPLKLKEIPNRLAAAAG